VDFFFDLLNTSTCTMALGSTQPLIEMGTRNLPGGLKGDRRVRLTNLPPSVSRLFTQSVGTSTSHNSMSLHGLFKRKFDIFYRLNL
jgi:hypothetical protein